MSIFKNIEPNIDRGTLKRVAEVAAEERVTARIQAFERILKRLETAVGQEEHSVTFDFVEVWTPPPSFGVGPQLIDREMVEELSARVFTVKIDGGKVTVSGWMDD